MIQLTIKKDKPNVAINNMTMFEWSDDGEPIIFVSHEYSEMGSADINDCAFYINPKPTVFIKLAWFSFVFHLKIWIYKIKNAKISDRNIILLGIFGVVFFWVATLWILS